MLNRKFEFNTKAKDSCQSQTTVARKKVEVEKLN
jgi:hypothetical protein